MIPLQMFHLCSLGLNRPTLRCHLSCILIPGRSATDPKICELRCFLSDTTSRLSTGSTPTLSLVQRPNPIKWIPAFHDKEAHQPQQYLSLTRGPARVLVQICVTIECVSTDLREVVFFTDQHCNVTVCPSSSRKLLRTPYPLRSMKLSL